MGTTILNFLITLITIIVDWICYQQAKLNCEVLWDDLALEVRWAVAGETIVLQLVGKIGKFTFVELKAKFINMIN